MLFFNQFLLFESLSFYSCKIYKFQYINNLQSLFNKMKKKNFVARELRSQKYRTRIVKPKKGKGSFKRKKKQPYSLAPIC